MEWASLLDARPVRRVIDLPATVIFVLVTTFTPGPNNILSASMGAFYGYRRTVPFLLGVTVGFLMIMGVCGSLSSLLNRTLPTAAPILRSVGALYILWLAVGTYRNSGRLLSRPEKAAPIGFWKGIALQVVNPKAAFYGLTLYTAFLAPLLDRRLTLVWSPVVFAFVTFSAISAWALGGHLIRDWINTPRRARWLGVLLSAALIYTALDLAGG